MGERGGERRRGEERRWKRREGGRREGEVVPALLIFFLEITNEISHFSFSGEKRKSKVKRPHCSFLKKSHSFWN